MDKVAFGGCVFLLLVWAGLKFNTLEQAPNDMRAQVVKLQLDYDELKLHTEQLRVIVSDQQAIIKKLLSTEAYVDSFSEGG